MRPPRLAPALLLLCLCAHRAEAAPDDLVFVSLQPAAFATLKPADQILAYELAQAALAGHRLSYPHRQAQQVLETIYTHFPAQAPAPLQGRFMDTLGRYYALHAFPPQDTRTLNPLELEDLALGARLAGARFPGVTTLHGLQQLLTQVRGPIFAPTPALAPSRAPAQPDNPRRRRTQTKALPPPPAELGAVQAHLAAALALAPPPQRAALEHLLASLREGTAAAPPGDPAPAAVDLLLDPGGPDGSGYRALVFLPDPRASAPLRLLAAHLADFAEGLPDPYGRSLLAPVDLQAASLLLAAGGDAPQVPPAVRVGGRVVAFPEIIAARGQHLDLPLARTFSCAPGDPASAARHHGLTTRLFAALREVFLQLPAPPEPRRERHPQDPAFAQARADLLALWVLGHPRSVQLGLLTIEAQQEVPRAYLRHALLALRGDLSGARERGRALVLHALKDRAQAVTLRQQDGALALCPRDPETLRLGVAALLSALARVEIAAERSHKVPALELMPDPDATAALAALVRTAAPLPTGVVFLNPEMTADRDAAGRVRAVRLQPGQDFLRQQVGYARSR